MSKVLPKLRRAFLEMDNTAYIVLVIGLRLSIALFALSILLYLFPNGNLLAFSISKVVAQVGFLVTTEVFVGSIIMDLYFKGKLK